MEIKNNFEVPLPPADAWKVLMDIPRIVPCMPGAELVEMVDDRTFKGKVSVRLGPVSLTFNGTAQFEDKNAELHTARAKAQGNDTKGRGGANATVTFGLTPMAAGTRVDVLTDVNLSGPVAQYGRGTGIIQGVATQLINQFATSLSNMLVQENVSGNAAFALNSEVANTTPTVRDVELSIVAPGGLAPPIRQVLAPPATSAKPISGLSLMLTVIRSAIAGFFKRTS